MGMKRTGFVSLCCLVSLCGAQTCCSSLITRRVPVQADGASQEQHQPGEASRSPGTQPGVTVSAVGECLEQPVQMDVLDHGDLQPPSAHHLVPWIGVFMLAYGPKSAVA